MFVHFCFVSLGFVQCASVGAVDEKPTIACILTYRLFYRYLRMVPEAITPSYYCPRSSTKSGWMVINNLG